MIASQEGDDAAYDLLLREVSIWLTRYFRRRLPIQFAEESCQETLLAIHLRKGTWVRGPFAPWVATIARFKWVDQLRRQYRTPEFVDGEDIAVEDHGHRSLSAILITRLLEDLKPAQASAIKLVKLGGKSIEEAADATGQSRSLVKVNVHRGLKRMLERLE